MIVWSGWGILVVLVAGLGFALGVSATPLLGFEGHAQLGPALGLLLAALGTYAFARLLGRREERVLLDPRTGQRVVLRHRDSLFFIPVRFWTWIFLVLAAVAAVTGAMAILR